MHLSNLTPIKHLDWKTPNEILTKEKHSVTHLKVFGCAVYVYLPKEKRVNKLAARSELMTYIGWVQGIKGYRFMTVDNRVFMGATATFDEMVFP
jgi:hypothetical protein